MFRPRREVEAEASIEQVPRRYQKAALQGGEWVFKQDETQYAEAR
jgi:hypothetical protein